MGSYICISLRPAQETQFSKQDQDKYIKPDSEGKKKKRLVGLGEIKTWKKCNIIQQETLNHTEGDGDAARDNEGWGIVRRGTGNRTANHKAWNPESYGEGPRIVQQILRRGTPDHRVNLWLTFGSCVC